MPVTSFEVGSTFTVIDKATAAILKISKAVSDLDKKIDATRLNLKKLADLNFTPLNKRLMTLNETIAKLNKSTDTTIIGMTTGVDAATASVRALANQWRAVGSARREAVAVGGNMGGVRPPRVAMPVYVPGAGGGGTPEAPGGSNRGRFWARTHVPGQSFSYGGGSMGSQIVGGGLAWGVYQNMSLQDLAAIGLIVSTRHDLSDATKAARLKQFQDYAKSASVVTGYGTTETGQAEVNILRLLGPGFSWKQKMGMMPQLLKEYAVESRMQQTDYAETAKAMVEFAHQAKDYTPQELSQANASISALSTMVPVGVPTVVKAMGYALPTLTSMGFGQTSTEEAVGLLLRAGLNTKSGTWLRTFGQALVTPPKGKGANAWAQTMLKLGLLDAKGQFTFKDANGQLDVLKAVQIARAHTAQMSPLQRNRIEQVFKTRGLEFESIVGDPKVISQLENIKDYMDAFSGRFHMILGEYNSTSEKQQVRQTWQQFNRALMDITKDMLPGITNGLKNLSSIFSAIDKIAAPIGLNGVVGQLTGGAAVGAIAGFMIGGPAGAGIGAAIGGVLGLNWHGAAELVKKQISGKTPESDIWRQSLFGPNAGAFAPLDDTKKTIEKGTQDGTKKGVEDALKNMHKSAFFGTGIGTPILIPASYTTSGQSGDGFGGGGGWNLFPGAPGYLGGGAGLPNVGGGNQSSGPEETIRRLMRHPSRGGTFTGKTLHPLLGGDPFATYERLGTIPPKHWTTGDIANALNGPPITNGALAKDRARFAAEVAKNPALLDRVLAISANEDPPGTKANISVLESMMNRASVRHTSLAAQALNASQGGYYAGSPRWSAIANPKLRALLMKGWAAALAGSNYSNFATDNSSSWLASKNQRLGRFETRQNWHGNHPGLTGAPGVESFEAPSWHGRAAYEEWLHHVETGDESPSPAIAHGGSSHSVQVHTNIQLDGHTVAKNTAKHLAKMGNRPSHSARQPDPYAAVPRMSI